MRLRWYAPVFAVPFAWSAHASAAAADRVFVGHFENVLGTSLDLKVGAPNQYLAERAARAVLEEIRRESSILSAWDRTSEFSAWSRTFGQPVLVSPDLFHVLDLFDQWRVRTNGALNPAAQSVIDAWARAAGSGRVPTANELNAAVRAANATHWSLNRPDRTATRQSDAPLVLASFAKSYVIDRAIDAAFRTGDVTSMVVNAGGDVIVRGAVTEPVAIANPRDDAENAAPLSEIVVSDRAVATSGDYRRGVDVSGIHYSHIVDPRSGQPAGDIISSTVVARNPTDAGALATAFSILPPAERRQLAASIPGIDYLLVEKSGRTIASPGWGALEVPRAAPAAPGTPTVAAAQGAWDPTMELAINFELPVLGGAKRPFVAIWIEDADRFPVRTLALWYHEDRFLTEMKAWYRADRLRSMSERTSVVRTMGSATRAPGKYSVKWDGKDNAGKPVKAGTYTVFIEVSREHGTYQLLKQELAFTGQSQQVQLTPGREIAGASLDYHKLGQ